MACIDMGGLPFSKEKGGVNPAGEKGGGTGRERRKRNCYLTVKID